MPAPAPAPASVVPDAAARPSPPSPVANPSAKLKKEVTTFNPRAAASWKNGEPVLFLFLSSHTIPGILSDDTSLLSPSPAPRDRHTIVSHRLHLLVVADSATPVSLRFSSDPDALSFQLRSGFPPDVEALYVGVLLSSSSASIDPSDQDALVSYLLEHVKCIHVFIPADIHEKFYQGFCKHHLGPLLHCLLSLGGGATLFDSTLWQAYLSTNRLFAERVSEALYFTGEPDGCHVWAYDYHLHNKTNENLAAAHELVLTSGHAQLIRLMLARGQLRCIGATTLEEDIGLHSIRFSLEEGKMMASISSARQLRLSSVLLIIKLTAGLGPETKLNVKSFGAVGIDNTQAILRVWDQACNGFGKQRVSP